MSVKSGIRLHIRGTPVMATFDPEASYVTDRQMRLCGQDLQPGDPVPAGVPLDRLRLLFTTGWVRPAGV